MGGIAGGDFGVVVGGAAVTPDHQEGRAAARRVQQANAEAVLPDARDALTMMTYHASLELRRIPVRERLQLAQVMARRLIANTRESLS